MKPSGPADDGEGKEVEKHWQPPGEEDDWNFYNCRKIWYVVFFFHKKRLKPFELVAEDMRQANSHHHKARNTVTNWYKYTEK